MNNLLQIILILALINFSGGQQVLQTLVVSGTSLVQHEITADMAEEEFGESEGQNFPNEDEVEKEWVPVCGFLHSTDLMRGRMQSLFNVSVPDSQKENHSPPPEVHC
jgi:hypothetical protein